MSDDIVYDSGIPAMFKRIKELESALKKCGDDSRVVIADALRLKQQAEDRVAELEKINSELCDTHFNQLMVYSRMNKEVEDLRSALWEIHRTGWVCEDFELCTHRACQASYTHYVIANKALFPDA